MSHVMGTFYLSCILLKFLSVGIIFSRPTNNPYWDSRIYSSHAFNSIIRLRFDDTEGVILPSTNRLDTKEKPMKDGDCVKMCNRFVLN